MEHAVTVNAPKTQNMPKNTEIKQRTVTSKETREVAQKDKHTRKARNRGSTENSYTGHCAHVSGSVNVKVQNIQHEN